MNKKHIEMMESGDWLLRTEQIENTEDITTIQEIEYTERNWFLPEFLRFHWLPTLCERTRRESYEAKAPNHESAIVQLRRMGVEGPIELVNVQVSPDDSLATVHFLAMEAEEDERRS